MVLIRGSQTKEGEEGCRNLSSTTTASQPKKADIIQCALSNFCWGCVGDALARRMPYEMLVPRCTGILQRVNCHFIRALCAPSVSPCGSCGMVMDGHESWSSTYCHFQRILLKGLCTEHAYESLRHGSPQAGLFLFALRVVLPFVVYFKELGN